ncbi:MAG: glycyl-radical enzyme activating protein [Dehalococcoidia bacterium]|nr:glycyl-radical enzyme activating protein [Dehalococcoidia bacterium]
MNRQPLVFDIKRHSLDDGPGIRTVIFFKGCPLRCSWCHNPESIDPGPEIGFYPSACIRCGDCAAACPNGAAHLDLPGRIDRAACKRCGTCVEACPGRGLRQIGRFYEIDELVEIVLRDEAYYETSGGGVTLSGGEPTLFIDYTSLLLQQLKQNGIQTAIETCGFFDFDEFNKKILGWLDLILFDIKLADPELHRKYTGKENEVIFSNLARLVRERPSGVIPRVPLIPGITAQAKNLEQIAAMFKEIGVRRCWLLPYNPLGLSKGERIGKPTAGMPGRMLPGEEMAWIKGFFSGIELIEM